MEIDIFGTKYTLIEDSNLPEDCDGQCGFYSKEIRIRPVDQMLQNDGTEQEKNERLREVIRHEVVHACLYESGLHRYATDETIVDWIAIQFNKMANILERAGGIVCE